MSNSFKTRNVYVLIIESDNSQIKIGHIYKAKRNSYAHNEGVIIADNETDLDYVEYAIQVPGCHIDDFSTYNSSKARYTGNRAVLEIDCLMELKGNEQVIFSFTDNAGFFPYIRFAFEKAFDSLFFNPAWSNNGNGQTIESEVEPTENKVIMFDRSKATRVLSGIVEGFEISYDYMNHLYPCSDCVVKMSMNYAKHLFQVKGYYKRYNV